jgi:hypothetical protein
MPTKVIILSGSMGCGKTTVLGEASDVLSSHHISHACVDLDAIATALIPENIAADVAQRNLAGIYANFMSAGVSRVLLAAAVENRRALDDLRGAMAGAEIVVCRLTAALATMERRLRVREPGMNQAKFLARAHELQQVLAAAHVEDFTVVNEDRGVTAVAREVLQRADWLP